MLYYMFLPLIGLVFLTSCSTVTNVESPNTGIEPKKSNCQVQFYNGIAVKENYIKLSKVESHIEKNFFFGGKANLEDEAFSELREKACELGGDAVIIDNFIESSALEFSHVHVWATIIKFIETTDSSTPDE